MLRRNLLQSLIAIPFISKFRSCSDEIEPKPFRTELNDYVDGTWTKITYDQNGKQLTYETSNGNILSQR